MDNKADFFTSVFDYKENSQSIGLGISPTIYGYEECPKKKKPIIYDKDVDTIHFVFQGEGILKKGDKSALIHSGTCFLLNRHCKVAYYPDYKNPWKYAWVEIAGDKSQDLFKKAGLEGLFPHKRIQQIDKVISIFDEIFEDPEYQINPSTKELIFTSELLKLISIMIEENEQAQLNKGKNTHQLQVEHIVTYIKTHYNKQTLSISSISKLFFFSQSYLTRLFESEKGISPIKYIIRVRMRAASDLLVNKGFSVTKVSSAVGYKTPLYFSKEFKRFYGVSPTEYLAGKDQR